MKDAIPILGLVLRRVYWSVFMIIKIYIDIVYLFGMSRIYTVHLGLTNNLYDQVETFLL